MSKLTKEEIKIGRIYQSQQSQPIVALGKINVDGKKNILYSYMSHLGFMHEMPEKLANQIWIEIETDWT